MAHYVLLGDDGDYSRIYVFTCCGKELNTRGGTTWEEPEPKKFFEVASFKFCPYCGTPMTGYKDVTDLRIERKHNRIRNELPKIPDLKHKYDIVCESLEFSWSTGERYTKTTSMRNRYWYLDSIPEFAKALRELREEHESDLREHVKLFGEEDLWVHEKKYYIRRTATDDRN